MNIIACLKVEAYFNRNSIRLSKKDSLRLSKKALTDILDEEKRGALRLSKREAMRLARDNMDIPVNLLHLTQRSLRLSKRSAEKIKKSLRLSKRSVSMTPLRQKPNMDHRMDIRLSKRQLAQLLTIKREATSKKL